MPRTRAGIPRRYIRTELDETHHMGIEVTLMNIIIELRVLDDTGRHIFTIIYSSHTTETNDFENAAYLTLWFHNLPVGSPNPEYVRVGFNGYHHDEANTIIAITLMSRMFRRITNFHKVQDETRQTFRHGIRTLQFEGTINFVDLPRLVKNTFYFDDEYWNV
jgi:hypothetical protein